MTSPTSPDPNQDMDLEKTHVELTELCRMHMPLLCRYATTLTKQRTVAQDAIHDVLLRYLIAKKRGEEIENQRFWLVMTLRNCIIRRISGFNTECAVQTDQESIPSEEECLQDQDAALRRALATLSQPERESLRLFIEGFAYEEIGDIMRIGKRAVGRLLYQALTNFRKAAVFAPRLHLTSAGYWDTFALIEQMRYLWAEAQYQKRVRQRVYSYLAILGFVLVAVATAAVLMR